MLEKGKKVFFMVMALCLLFSVKASAKPDDLFSRVPQEAMAVVSIVNLEGDAGLGYILKLWRAEIDRRITAGLQDYRKRRYIDKIGYDLTPQQVVGAFFGGTKGEGHLPYFLIVRLPTKGEQLATLKDSVEKLIKKKLEILRQMYSGYEIVYTLDRYPKELSAFAVMGNDMVIATSVELVKQAIDVYQKKAASILENQEFVKLRDKYLGTGDMFIYVNNQDKGFSKSLKKWEDKNGIKLLLSDDQISGLGITFDVANDNTAGGKVVFTGAAGADDLRIKDDILFLNEVMKRKFLGEGVVYENAITSDANYRALEISLKDTKMFWQKVFGPKAQEFLGKSKVSSAASLPEKGGGGIIVKIFIGIISVAFFILILKNMEPEKDEQGKP
ncbi:MAG: DUF3352 domain-containing protein [Candidatus Omnitrophota bacterium]